MQDFRGNCETGNIKVTTEGIISTNAVQGSFPSCLVTVNVHGGGLATIYSDNGITPLSNPFTAGSNGAYFFYAANGRYDVTISGAGLPSPVTLADVVLLDATTFIPFTEQAAPSGQAGVDILYGDSSSHRLKMINNNSAGDVIVGANTTDTLTNKTISSGSNPISGGAISGASGTFSSGVSATTGTFSGAVTAPSAAISGNETVGGTLAVTGSLTGSSGTFSGAVVAASFSSGVINSACVVGEIVGGVVKYANIAAAVADSNCVVIELPAVPGCYQETWSSGLTVHGKLVIRVKGCATINQNGNNPLTLPSGTANDNFSLLTDFPISAHANGSNSGVTFSGYTGTGAAIKIGDNANPTLNANIRGVNIDLTSAGIGAVGISLNNTTDSIVEDVNCGMNANNQGCILLDGTGGFTGVLHLNRITYTGNTGSGQFGIRGQNLVTDVMIQGGNGNLNGASSICYDAENSTEFHFQGPNCNAASQAIKEVGSLSRLTGWIRIDSGVTSFGTVTSGAFFVFCENCSSSTPFTDSGGNASFLTADGLALNSTKWRIVGTSTSFSIKDGAASTSPFSCNTGGNCFLGEAANQIILDNNGSLFISGTTSGNVKLSVPAIAGSNAVLIPAATGTALVTGNGAVPLQTKRVTTGSIGATTRADTTVTWATSFVDTSYTASCTVVETTVAAGTQSLTVERIHTVNAGNIVVSVFNGTAGALTGTLNCIAIHD